MRQSNISKDDANFLTGRVNVFWIENSPEEKALQIKSLRAERMRTPAQTHIIRWSLGLSYNRQKVRASIEKSQRQYDALGLSYPTHNV